MAWLLCGYDHTIVRSGDNGILAEDGTVLSDKKARLPRVVITSLGTG